MKYPNAYYTGLGTYYQPPHVHLRICEGNGKSKLQTIKLGDGIPFRMLTYPLHLHQEVAQCFIGMEKLPVRSQEQILRDSGYPSTNKMPDNFRLTMEDKFKKILFNF